MRTTLQVDDDVLEAAKSLARAQNRPLGKVLSELARQGLTPRTSAAKRKGFPVFEVSGGAAPLTLELVNRANEEK